MFLFCNKCEKKTRTKKNRLICKKQGSKIIGIVQGKCAECDKIKKETYPCKAGIGWKNEQDGDKYYNYICEKEEFLSIE